MDTKNLTVSDRKPSYQAQMSALRVQLAGRPYCPAIKDLLPELSKATIHGAVNGRNENELVLQAMRIVVHTANQEMEGAQKRLAKQAERLGIID